MRREVGLEFRQLPGLDALLVRNEVLELLTLRLFRFWARTDLRRYLWSATFIDGEALEYTGRPRDLLIGFLIVFAAGALPFVVVSGGGFYLQTDYAAYTVFFDCYFALFLVGYAAGEYRACQYRFSQTLWRGISAELGGRALVFGVRYLGWAIAFCVTAGLSVPWACADLAHYRIENLRWGNFHGRFEGTAQDLVRPWMTVWGLCFGPLFFYAAWLVGAADGNIAALYWEAARIADLVNSYRDSHTLYIYLLPILGLFFAQYFFKMRWVEWCFNSTSIGPLRLSCRLPDLFSPAVVRGLVCIGGYVAAALYVIIESNLGRNGLFADFDYESSVWACLGLALAAAGGVHFLWRRLLFVPSLALILSHTRVSNFEAADGARCQSAPERRHAEGLWDIFHANLV